MKVEYQMLTKEITVSSHVFGFLLFSNKLKRMKENEIEIKELLQMKQL